MDLGLLVLYFSGAVSFLVVLFLAWHLARAWKGGN